MTTSIGKGSAFLDFVESAQDARVMFKWLKSRRRRKMETVSVPPDADRDSGEEEYESA